MKITKQDIEQIISQLELMKPKAPINCYKNMEYYLQQEKCLKLINRLKKR